MRTTPGRTASAGTIVITACRCGLGFLAPRASRGGWRLRAGLWALPFGHERGLFVVNGIDLRLDPLEVLLVLPLQQQARFTSLDGRRRLPQRRCGRAVWGGPGNQPGMAGAIVGERLDAAFGVNMDIEMIFRDVDADRDLIRRG
jgi:hypothetical protein